jgi:hypothetical protein
MALGFAVTVAMAVFFLGMGVYALVAPAALIRPFGIMPETSTSRSEIRAVYGGFGLAMASVLGYAAFREGDVAKGILITVGVALAGMALGRIVSALVDARPPFYPNWFYFIVEAVAAAALFAVA